MFRVRFLIACIIVGAAVAAPSAMVQTAAGQTSALGAGGAVHVPIRSADISVDKSVADRATERERALDEMIAARERSEYHLQADSNLMGKVQAFNEVGTPSTAKVKLLFLRDGRPVQQVTPNEDGVFQAGGLEPGIYSVVAAGPSGFSATAIRLLPPPDRPPAPQTSTIGNAKVTASFSTVDFPLSLSTIQPVDVRAAFALVVRHVPTMAALYRRPPPNRVTAGGDVLRDGWFRPGSPSGAVTGLGVRRPSEEPALVLGGALEAAFAEEENEIRAVRAGEAEEILEAHQTFTFPLNSDKHLDGMVRDFDSRGNLVPSKVKMYFLRDGQVQYQAQPFETGEFRVDNMDEGYYSLIAVGASGFAAMGVRIMPPPDRPQAPKANTIGRLRAVSQPGTGGGITVPITPIPPSDVPPATEFAAQEGVPGVEAPPLTTPASTTPLATTAEAGAAGAAGTTGGAGAFATLATAAAVAVGLEDDQNQSTVTTSTSTTVSDNGAGS